VRLDHLLSKELISTTGPGGSLPGRTVCPPGDACGVVVAEARPRPHASGVVAHGWNIDEESPGLVTAASTPAPWWGGQERGGHGAGGLLSTLLGPEATGRLSCGRVVGCFCEDTGHWVAVQTGRLAGGGGCGCLVGSSVA
jgi:hypothetical protein